MKYALLLFVACASGQLFSMDRFEKTPAKVSLDTLVQLYRDKNLTIEKVKAFFEKPADRGTIKEFTKSAAATFIKARGELYKKTNDSTIELYEMENAYAGFILLAFCQTTKKEQLKMHIQARALIEHFEKLKQPN